MGANSIIICLCLEPQLTCLGSVFFFCIPLHHPLSLLVIMHLPFYSPHCLFPAAVSRLTHPHSCRRTQTRILHNKPPTTVNPHRVHIFSCPPNITPAWLNEYLNQFTFTWLRSGVSQRLQRFHTGLEKQSKLSVSLELWREKKMPLQLFPFTASSLPQRRRSRAASLSLSHLGVSLSNPTLIFMRRLRCGKMCC